MPCVVSLMTPASFTFLLSLFVHCLKHPDNKDEIIVLIRVVVENSAAYGVLRQNQRLYHVNGTKVDGKSMQNAILVLKAQSIGSVCLGIADPVASHSEPSSVVSNPAVFSA